jgi:uncharacterized protein YecT (DUF1311 family)
MFDPAARRGLAGHILIPCTLRLTCDASRAELDFRIREFLGGLGCLRLWFSNVMLNSAKITRLLRGVGGVSLAISASLTLVAPATAQNTARVARCVAIQDVDERIDCLEGKSSPPDQRGPAPGIPRAAEAGPSYDCRMATASVERAICGDTELSGWDQRMSQQYQQALRLRRGPDYQSLVDSQRSWIQQRNSACAVVAGNAVWSCVLEMTKQRIAFLSQAPPLTVPTPAPLPLAQSTPRPQAVPSVAPPAAVQKSSGVTTTANPSPAPEPSSGPNPLFVVIFIVGAIIGVIVVYNNIKRREEERRRAAERQRLIAKYGAEIADRILAQVVWQGMTEEQLLESRGSPADKDYEVRKSITKETWKYGQTGKNRFSNRIFLENGIVTGWKQ